MQHMFQRTVAGPCGARHRPLAHLLYIFRAILIHISNREECSTFGLFISRGEPGKTGRVQFGGSMRARFAPQIVGILCRRVPAADWKRRLGN